TQNQCNDCLPHPIIQRSLLYLYRQAANYPLREEPPAHAATAIVDWFASYGLLAHKKPLQIKAGGKISTRRHIQKKYRSIFNNRCGAGGLPLTRKHYFSSCRKRWRFLGWRRFVPATT